MSAVTKTVSWYDRHPKRSPQEIGREFLERVRKLRALLEGDAKYERIFSETYIARDQIGVHLRITTLPAKVLGLLREGKIRPRDAVFIASVGAQEQDAVDLAEAIASGEFGDDEQIYFRSHARTMTVHERLVKLGLTEERRLSREARRRVMFRPPEQRVAVHFQF